MAECGEFLSRFPEVRFDLDRIDMGKKGWTRYYPFSISGKDFIMRIFLTREYLFQPKAEVLYEDTTGDKELTFQILPGLNKILEGCRIKPHNPNPSSPVDLSS